MCIIAYYKKGQKATRERIEHMMRGNPDGVGIAWNTGKRVFFTKGIVTVDAVMRAFDSIKDIAKDVVFHARIATSGGISAEKCHPYPMTQDVKLLDKTSGGGNAPIVFHNGVFSIDIEKGLNDSQTFIKNVLFPLYSADARGLREGKFDTLIEMAVRGSRLLLIYPDCVRTFGTWTTGDDGILYSNGNYKPWTYAASRYAWDDDGGWWESARATGRASAKPATANATNTTNAASTTGAKYNAEWWRAHAAKGGAKNGKQ